LKAIDHVGPGWAPIVQKALDALGARGVKIAQVKEKFGDLRIYPAAIYDQETMVTIKEAERECAVTCEYCGEPGEKRDVHGWVKTACEKHKDGPTE
jgi:hypothetical protein